MFGCITESKLIDAKERKAFILVLTVTLCARTLLTVAHMIKTHNDVRKTTTTKLVLNESISGYFEVQLKLEISCINTSLHTSL